jgi:hypothetical protein
VVEAMEKLKANRYCVSVWITLGMTALDLRHGKAVEGSASCHCHPWDNVVSKAPHSG